MSSAAPLDTTIAVVTPENISFEYQLAGPFRRLPAFLLDLTVQIGLILAIIAVVILLQTLTRLSVPPAFFIATFFVGYFLIAWFYGAAMEACFNGRTIGKWACGLRVICIDGRPIDGIRALIRNLLRVADLAPYAALSQWDDEIPPLFLIPTGIVGLVCTICNRRLQRLGDLAAGTMVVVDEKSWRLPVTRVDDPRAAALATFIPGDFRVSRSLARTLATYVERRVYLTPNRRREVARGLTEQLLERFEFRPDIDPDLLMLALYHATFLTDSKNPSPDLGPLAGHSPLIKDAPPSATASFAAPPAAGSTPSGTPPVAAGDDSADLPLAQLIDDVPPGADR